MSSHTSRGTKRKADAANGPGAASNPFDLDDEGPGAYSLMEAAAQSMCFSADIMDDLTPMPMLVNNMPANMQNMANNMAVPMPATDMFGMPMPSGVPDMAIPDIPGQVPINMPNNLSNDMSTGLSTAIPADLNTLDIPFGISPDMPITDEMLISAGFGFNVPMGDLQVPIDGDPEEPNNWVLNPSYLFLSMPINQSDQGAMPPSMTPPMSTTPMHPTQTYSTHVSAPFPENAPAPSMPSSMPVYETASMPSGSPVQAMRRNSENHAAPQHHTQQSVSLPLQQQQQQQQPQQPQSMHYPPQEQQPHFYRASSHSPQENPAYSGHPSNTAAPPFHTRHMQTPEPSQPAHQGQPMYADSQVPHYQPQQQLQQPPQQLQQPPQQLQQPPQQQHQQQQPQQHQHQQLQQPQQLQQSPQQQQPPQQPPQQLQQPQQHQPQQHQHQQLQHQPPQQQHQQPQQLQHQHQQPQHQLPQHQYSQYPTSAGPQYQSDPVYSPHGQQSPPQPTFTRQPTYHHHPSQPQTPAYTQAPHPSQPPPQSQSNHLSLQQPRTSNPSPQPRQPSQPPQQQTSPEVCYTNIPPQADSSTRPSKARRSSHTSSPNQSSRSVQTNEVPRSYNAAQQSQSMPPPPVPSAGCHYSTPASAPMHTLPSQSSASAASSMPPPPRPRPTEQSQPPASQQSSWQGSSSNGYPGSYSSVPVSSASTDSYENYRRQSSTHPYTYFTPVRGFTHESPQPLRPRSPDPTRPTSDQMIATLAESRYPLSPYYQAIFKKYNEENVEVDDVIRACPATMNGYQSRLQTLENYCRMRTLSERLAEDAREAARKAAGGSVIMIS